MITDPARLPEAVMDSKLNPYMTYTFDKLSCLRGAYFAHVVFAYLVFLTGLGCFVTRLWRRLHPAHLWLGRAYIHSMLWCTATSLLINNTGLPVATLVSFIWVLGGMCVGWVVINIHQVLMARAAERAAGARIKAEGGVPGGDLPALIRAERGRIAGTKTFVQRFFSLKAAHGVIMFVSWINISGRIFASNQTGDFTCYTYPYYKQIDTPDFSGVGQPLKPVPVHDPEFSRLPWAKMGVVNWALALLFGPMLGAMAVGALYSWAESRRAVSARTAAAPAAAAEDEAAGNGKA